ncbi:MAG TPA: hypothetical protein VFK02_29585 [Kofleriaceae bacterium]|nr:hypothetical protein [Kofleriaceae bacterium]
MPRCLLVLAVLAACSDSGSEPALSDAVSLACPRPGALPFRLSSSGFQSSISKMVASEETRNKDEASDTLGNPGGVTASVYALDGERPSTAPIAYHGEKARTQPSGGLLADPLPGENVSLWYYDPDATMWRSIGSTKTADDGSYDLPSTGFVAPSGRPIYAMLEADGSCAAHYDYLFPPGSKVVVTDIDGTLTLSDNELFMQLGDEAYVPKLMPAADRLMQAWATKGYPIVYLTARPHSQRAESRGWLTDLKFPDGPLITAGNGAQPDTYKALWMMRMIQDFGWNVVAVYGNAATDITAYASAGIPAEHTFIVGPLSTTSGITGIPGMDFSAHITGFVAAQPTNTP